MTPTRKVLFGVGMESGVHQVSEMLAHARLVDEAGLDVVGVSDHPYFAERLDAYAAVGFVLGATNNIAGATIVTNLLSRPAPLLARTVAGLSAISGGRVVLGLGRAATRRRSSPSVFPACRLQPEYERWKRRSWLSKRCPAAEIRSRSTASSTTSPS